MDSQPLISIITPVYNGERFLGATLESVLAQTYTNWEQLIVDDGSTDGTAAIAQAYAARDPRIRYIRQSNQRQAAARNRALTEARGEIVAFLDGDDLWLPEKLDICVREFLAGRQDLLFTDGYQFSDDAQLAHPQTLPGFNVTPATYEGREGLRTMLRGNRIPMLTVVALKQAIVAAGGFEQWAIGEDYQLWLKMLYEGHVLRAIAEPLALYRLHSGSLSAADRQGVLCAFAILRELAERYPGAVEYAEVMEPWMKRFAAGMKNRSDLLALKKLMEEWRVENPQARKLLGARRLVIPFDSLKRKLRRAFLD